MSRKKTFLYAFKASIPVMTGYLVLGMGFGILLQSKGYGILWALAMSIFIYAGSMQYAAVDLITGGAGIIASAVMTLMVNFRHVFYGITMLDKYKGTGKKKPYLIFSLTDETFSLVCSPKLPDGTDINQYYFFVSLLDQIYWVAGSAAGSVIGNVFPFSTDGIDFAMTALFFVIMLGQWESEKEHKPALFGIGISVVCLFLFGAANFLIPSMLLIAAALIAARRNIRWYGK